MNHIGKPFDLNQMADALLMPFKCLKRNNKKRKPEDAKKTTTLFGRDWANEFMKASKPNITAKKNLRSSKSMKKLRHHWLENLSLLKKNDLFGLRRNTGGL